MIAKNEFWQIMEAYGAQIKPAQIVFYIAAILLVVWLFLKPGRIQTLVAKLYLSIAFAWNGIAFYFVLARDMAGGSYGNYIFGSVFIIVAVLFAVDLFRQKMRFSLPTVGWRKYATLVLALLVFCYPLFGMIFGRSFTSLLMPGAFPCPTTALGLLLLTMALPQVDKTIYLLLLVCAIPFTPFVQIARHGVYEDTILFATGVYSLVLLLRYWKAENLPA
jgi:uncharacterized membrane protein YtjA (UPF0391 family)